MIVTGFDDRQHRLNFNKHRKNRGRSNLHKRVKNAIKDVFESLSVYEDVVLPGSRRGTKTSLLIADFFLPDLMLIVEAHGEQHFKYIPYFHGAVHEGGKMNFLISKQRDAQKIEWCDINDIDLVSLHYDETEEEWKQKLKLIRPRD